MSRRTIFRAQRRLGFTLFESLVAITITALSGSVLMMAVETSLGTADTEIDLIQATGIAEQLIDEALGLAYFSSDPGSPFDVYLGPTESERQGASQCRAFDDIDDFNRCWAMPPRDRWGIPLGEGDGAGGYRDQVARVCTENQKQWLTYMRVYYVDQTDPRRRLGGNQAGNARAIQVWVIRQTDKSYEIITTVRRVIGYVPSS